LVTNGAIIKLERKDKMKEIIKEEAYLFVEWYARQKGNNGESYGEDMAFPDVLPARYMEIKKETEKAVMVNFYAINKKGKIETTEENTWVPKSVFIKVIFPEIGLKVKVKSTGEEGIITGIYNTKIPHITTTKGAKIQVSIKDIE
jgi:hypothetical protein